jgi:hypothetical protein
MRIKIKVLLVLISLLLFIVPPTFADYADNFDQYPAGLQNPWSTGNPWTFTPSAGCTWGSSQVLATPLNNVDALSPPNVYGIAFPSGCAGTLYHSDLSELVNATSPSVTFTFHMNVDEAAGTFSTDLVELFMCGTQQFLTINGTYAGFDLILLSGVKHWTTVSASVPMTPGVACAGGIDIRTVASAGDSGAFRVDIDNTYVKGAQAVFANADFFMLTPNNAINGHGLWFNVSNFADTKIVVNYSGTTPAFILNNVTAPDVYIPLVGAKLVTVYLGTYNVGSTIEQGYRRAIVPTSTTHQIMYLNNPIEQTVITYTFQVQDFSGEFPAGSEIEIILGTEVMSSGYLDSNHQFTTGLLPGDYSVKLVSGSNTFDSLISLSPNNPSVIVTVPSVTINFPNNQQTAISCLGFWTSSTQIEIFYRDATNTTTSITLTLLMLNFTGTVIVHTMTFSPGPYGNLTQVLSGSYVNLNNTASYRVTCTATDTFGSGVVYPSVYGQPVSGGSASTVLPSFPDVLHLGTVFPGMNQPTTQVGGLGMITAIAATFGEFTGPIGAVVVAFFATFLIGGGWLTISVTLGAVFVMITIIGALIWAERRNR